jgi:hypothetical protein
LPAVSALAQHYRMGRGTLAKGVASRRGCLPAPLLGRDGLVHLWWMPKTFVSPVILDDAVRAPPGPAESLAQETA